jgi:hypothetical protein
MGPAARYRDGNSASLVKVMTATSMRLSDLEPGSLQQLVQVLETNGFRILFDAAA